MPVGMVRLTPRSAWVPLGYVLERLVMVSAMKRRKGMVTGVSALDQLYYKIEESYFKVSSCTSFC
jgi:hypothetical protein